MYTCQQNKDLAMMHLKVSKTIAAPAPTKSYADSINEKLESEKSIYLELPDRIKQAIELAPATKEKLLDSVVQFKKKYVLTAWDDLGLCRAEKTTLDKLLIDATFQRELELARACMYVEHFLPYKVSPLFVYEVPEIPGKYAVWEGQHTTIMLFIIAVFALKLDPKDCVVPIAIFKGTTAQLRDSFIGLSTVDKQRMDAIDIFQQQVRGVLVDKSTKPEWELVTKKQKVLARHGLFVTHNKFGNTKKPGALTRLQEVTDLSYPYEVTEAFAKYFKYVCNSSRPAQPKEVWMMYEYFKLLSPTELTDDYIKAVADSINASFPGGKVKFDTIYKAAKSSYTKWYKAKNKSTAGISFAEHKIGLTFITAQIAKNLKKPHKPAKLLAKDRLWPVAAGDLL